jgi:hypothetical protein
MLNFKQELIKYMFSTYFYKSWEQNIHKYEPLNIPPVTKHTCMLMDVFVCVVGEKKKAITKHDKSSRATVACLFERKVLHWCTEMTYGTRRLIKAWLALPKGTLACHDDLWTFPLFK